MELTREIFGNIPIGSKISFYLFAALSIVVFAKGVQRRVRLWRLGRPSVTSNASGVASRIWSAHFGIRKAVFRQLIEILGQKRVRDRGLPGLAHVLVFSGFLVLFAGTCLIAAEHILAAISTVLHFHYGTYYAIFEIVLDVFGLAFMVACIPFAYRRWRRPESVGHNNLDWVVLAAFFALGITGFAIEGLRILWHHTPQPGFSPVGLGVARFFAAFGLTENGARTAHFWLWWIHAVLAMGTIAAFPFTRLFHGIAGSLNVLFGAGPMGHLRHVSIEELEETGTMGAGEIRHFSRWQLLQVDACVECNRCQEGCPAYADGAPLTPRGVVQDIRRNLDESGPKLLALSDANSELPEGLPELHGATVSAETLWACTACSACVDLCPVRIDPLEMIVDMRRYLVGEARLRGAPAVALRRIENSGNPWGLSQDERLAWAHGLDVPTVQDRPDFEILYWVGCAASYDREIQKVARAMVRLLRAADVHFAVLGTEELCTGESARRLGEEFLFQEMATRNIECLKKYNVRRILTHCPHCLNSFRLDYPQLGGNYEVIHHSEFLSQLIREGRLTIHEHDSESEDGDRITFHDPCYLARVHGVTEAPRTVIREALGGSGNLAETPRHGKNTSCCGAGGGRMWFDDPASERVGRGRIEDVLRTGAQTVAVACPFCRVMMRDGIAPERPDVRVADIAEILDDSVDSE